MAASTKPSPTSAAIGTPRTRWWRFLAAGLAYGLFTWLSLPPLNWWPFAFVTLLPLICAGFAATNRPFRAALLAGLGTIPLWAVLEAFLINVTPPGYPLLVLYLSLYPALFVWLLSIVRRRLPELPAALVVGALWTALEVLRGDVVMTGYPWFFAAHPLVNAPFIRQPAAVFGAIGVSFLVAALAGALAQTIGWCDCSRRRGLWSIGAVCIVWIALGLLGAPPNENPSAHTINIGIVQTNVEQDNKLDWTPDQKQRDWARFEELTLTAARPSPPAPTPDFIIWPETMFPGGTLTPAAVEVIRAVWTHHNPDLAAAGNVPLARYFSDRLFELQRTVGVPMIIGAVAFPEARMAKDAAGVPKADLGPRHNSVFIVNEGGVLDDRYDKLELTPFGEVIPYVWRWPKVQAWVTQLGAGLELTLKPGNRASPIHIPVGNGSGAELAVATPICFEATRPAVCRRLVQNSNPRAPLLINMSNDGWFGRFPGGREHHLLISRWRCVELGVPMVRAVNTGISAHIDRSGNVVQSGPEGRKEDERTDGILAASVRVDPAGAPTIYGRIGDVFAWGVLALGGALIAACLLRRRMTPNPAV